MDATCKTNRQYLWDIRHLILTLVNNSDWISKPKMLSATTDETAIMMDPSAPWFGGNGLAKPFIYNTAQMFRKPHSRIHKIELHCDTSSSPVRGTIRVASVSKSCSNYTSCICSRAWHNVTRSYHLRHGLAQNAAHWLLCKPRSLTKPTASSHGFPVLSHDNTKR